MNKYVNKKVIAMAVAIAMTATLGSGCVIAESDDIAVVYDGAEIQFDVKPEIENGRVMVPMRKIFEAFGAKVKWDGDTETITAKKKSKTIQMTIGSNDMTKNDKAYTFDTSPVIRDGRTLVPVRAISDMLGLDVEWVEEDKTVVITTPDDEDNAWELNVGKIKLDKTEVEGEGVSITDNVITISSGGDFEITGDCDNGQIVVDTDDKVKLRLSGMSLENKSGSAIYIKNADKAYITLTENTKNVLTDSETYTSGDEKEKACITSRDNLEIKGKGSLTVNGNYNHAIDGSDSVEISNGNIVIIAKNDGIHVNDTLEISGGKIDITAEGDGMQSDEIVDITDGEINVKTSGYVKVSTSNRFDGNKGQMKRPEEMTENEIQEMQKTIENNDEEESDTSSKGIKADWLLDISGGDITVNSTDHSIHCASDINIFGGKITLSSESKKGISGHGNVTIDDGEILIEKATEGIESKACLVINGGNMDITASDDGLNAGGTGANAGFGGQPPEMPNGEMQAPPEMPNGEMQTPPEMPNGENGEMQTPPEMPNGENGEMQAPPEMPNGENGEMQTPPEIPNGDKNNRHNGGRRPDMQNGGGMMMPNHGRNESDEQDKEHHIEINGGNIKISADADGIDSNGSLFINGGTITVNAQASGAESAFDTDGAFVINGGTVVGISGSGMDESPNKYSKQNVIIAYTADKIESGKTVTIKNSDNKKVAEYTALKGGNKIVYSSDELQTGETYTIYVEGEEIGNGKIEESITTIGTKSNQGPGGGRREFKNN